MRADIDQIGVALESLQGPLRMSIDRADLELEERCRLGLAEVEVVPTDDDFALPFRHTPKNGQDPQCLVIGNRVAVDASRSGAAPLCGAALADDRGTELRAKRGPAAQGVPVAVHRDEGLVDRILSDVTVAHDEVRETDEVRTVFREEVVDDRVTIGVARPLRKSR